MTTHPITTRQVKAARALLRWSQATLAVRAGVSPTTLKRLEGLDGEFGGTSTIKAKIVDALSMAGIEFLGECGVALRKV